MYGFNDRLYLAPITGCYCTFSIFYLSVRMQFQILGSVTKFCKFNFAFCMIITMLF